MSTLIVIPARYASTRYPGKPLVSLKGAGGLEKTLIQRTWETAQTVKGISRVVIATDDHRIQEAATDFGAETVITSPDCRNGTERCAQAFAELAATYDVVVNLQGDAALTPPWFIEDVVAGLKSHPTADMATPVLRCDGRALSGLLEDRRHGRVGGTTAVFDASNHALYFSKEVIPFTHHSFVNDEKTPIFHHVGVYAYRPDALLAYPNWAIGELENLEGLEQLRFLEQGSQVLCVEVESKGRQFWELNNPEDVSKIETMLLDMRQS